MPFANQSKVIERTISYRKSVNREHSVEIKNFFQHRDFIYVKSNIGCGFAYKL